MTIEILCLICVPSVIAWFLGVAFADFLEWCQHVDWTFSVTTVTVTPVLVEEVEPEAEVAVPVTPVVVEEIPPVEVEPEVAEPVAEVAIAGELTDHYVLDTFVFGDKSCSPVVSRIVSGHLSKDIMPKAAPVAFMVDETPIKELSRERGALYLEDVKFSESRETYVRPRPSVAKKMVAKQSYIEAFVPMEAVQ